VACVPALAALATPAGNPVSGSIRWKPGPGWLPILAGRKLRKSADFRGAPARTLATGNLVFRLALGRSGAPAPGIRNGPRRNHVFCGFPSRPLRYRLSPFVPCSEVSKVSAAFRRSIVSAPTRGTTLTRLPHPFRWPAGTTSPSSDRVRDVSFTRQHDILSHEHVSLRSRHAVVSGRSRLVPQVPGGALPDALPASSQNPQRPATHGHRRKSAAWQPLHPRPGWEGRQ
jgi:hypothetical protein